MAPREQCLRTNMALQDHSPKATMAPHDHRLGARWHPGSLSRSPNGTPFLWFWSRWHPGSLSSSEKGALGSVPWSHKAPRDHSFGARWRPGSLSRSPKSTPGSFSGARNGSPAARWGPGGEILHTFIKFDVSGGGTAGSGPHPVARILPRIGDLD